MSRKFTVTLSGEWSISSKPVCQLLEQKVEHIMIKRPLDAEYPILAHFSLKWHMFVAQYL